MGELTLIGQQQARDLGGWLRQRYVDQLGFLPADMKVTTHAARRLQSRPPPAATRGLPAIWTDQAWLVSACNCTSPLLSSLSMPVAADAACVPLHHLHIICSSSALAGRHHWRQDNPVCTYHCHSPGRAERLVPWDPEHHAHPHLQVAVNDLAC